MLKIDCLALGMLTCIRKAFDLLNAPAPSGLRHRRSTSTAFRPRTRPSTPCCSAADSIGVFQVESAGADVDAAAGSQPRCFYDLVIEVAIVRPGPIQGNMVHPYLRRRSGQEEATYPSEAVRQVLAKTLGVPLFQEQAMALAIVGGGFTPGEADQLRRAMAAWKRKSERLEELCHRLMQGLVRNGYSRDFAKRLFDQIMGFGEYGFPESHAASFALIVYVSAWLKHHHPAAFAAALINSQPMGFYAPAQIVRDAREHGVEVRPVDVLHSGWDCRLEGEARNEPEDGAAAGPALRLGMRLVKGLGQADADALERAVAARGTFADLPSLQRASGASVRGLRRLAYADAFGSLGLDRQQALWEVRALREPQPQLWDDAAGEPAPAAPPPRLPPVPPLGRVLHDYAATSLSLRSHPMAFARTALDRLGVAPAAALRDAERFPNGAPASTAGIVLVRQRPGTAKGIIFMTLEDETGSSNLIVRPEIFDRDRRAARHATAVLAHGKIERAEGVIHLMAAKIESLDGRIGEPPSSSRDFH